MRTAVTLVLLLLLALAVRAEPPAFPPLVVVDADSYFDAGFAVGNATADRIRFRLQNPIYSDIGPVRDFLATPVGALLFSTLFNNSVLLFPHLMEELRGIAAGAGLRYQEDIFLLNALEDVEVYLPDLGGTLTPNRRGDAHRRRQTGLFRSASTERCTDIQSHPPPGVGVPCWGHNEDGEDGDNRTTFLSKVRIFDRDGEGKRYLREAFVSYAYPGTVAGEAFGWNHHGLVFTENFLWNDVSNYRGVPAQLVNRAVFSLRNVDEVLAVVSRIPTVIGFSLNVGSITEGSVEMLNIEVDPLNRIAVTRARPTIAVDDLAVAAIPGTGNPPYAIMHTNVYTELTMAGQNATGFPDSFTRLRQLATYSLPNTTTDIRFMLGDTNQSATYPVYCDGTGLDGSVTLATVVFDFDGRQARVFTQNPRSNVSAYTFDLSVW